MRAPLPLPYCSALAAGIVVPTTAVQWTVATALLLLGGMQLARPRHLRWGNMRPGRVGLVVWSFLVATAHETGLMVLPIWLTASAAGGHAHSHAAPASGVAADWWRRRSTAAAI